MAELFPIRMVRYEGAIAGQRPVVFHGVNKSGSLATANVMRAAYVAAGRANQFFSTYHAVPRDFDQFAEILSHSTGHAFFVAHYIYGRLVIPLDALLVAGVRHPLSRTLSVHGWMKRNHLRKHGSVKGFPSLEKWLLKGKAKYSTQMAQLAFGFGSDRRRRIDAMLPEDMRELALKHLRDEFAWFGVAELFEESIFVLAHICGLGAVPAWQKDTRNEWRDALQDTEEHLQDLIRDVLAEEFAFYEGALATFRSRVADIDFGAALPVYKKRCEGEYGERLLA